MKKIKIAFLSLLATCTIASCDFLEKEPYKIVPENYFQNEAEAQSFLTVIIPYIFTIFILFEFVYK